MTSASQSPAAGWVRTIASTLAFALGTTQQGGAQSAPPAPSGIIGIWRVTAPSALVEIAPCADSGAGALCGRVIWYGEGVAATDRKNPDKGLRARPVCGIEAISHAHPRSATEYDGAALYDPSEGARYRGSISLASPDVLEVRYQWGLFHQTVRWRRETADVVRCASGS